MRFVSKAVGVTQTAMDTYPAEMVGGSGNWTDPEGLQLIGSPLAYSFQRKACEQQLNQVSSDLGNECVCAPGYFAELGEVGPGGPATLVCNPCPTGKYQEGGSAECIECPLGKSTLFEASTSIDDCVCR